MVERQVTPWSDRRGLWEGDMNKERAGNRAD